MQLIFEKGTKERHGVTIPKKTVPTNLTISKKLLRETEIGLPNVSELDVLRHYTNLSKLNFSVDTNFYPLGSCTMKYNPRANEAASRMSGFANLHPVMSINAGGEEMCQGALQLLFEVQEALAEITGMKAICPQPMAGAHGELAGLMLIRAYHKKHNHKKTKIIVPDSAHGTNPATATIVGYDVISIPSNKSGGVDLEALKAAMNDEVAGMMLTCPNTLGLFDTSIKEICKIIHQYNGLMYYDGANLNAIAGRVRPGDLGFDVIHLNLHKSFSTPHGGGGPGSGVIGVSEKLIEFLPTPHVIKDEEGIFKLEYNIPNSIGAIAPFFGNYGVIIRAFSYILMLGAEGIRNISNFSVLHANYIKEKLKDVYELPYDNVCMHECVFSAIKQLQHDVSALDIAKALLDRGFHAPTMYFPLIVKEALMIEPTETESKETIDAFIDAMRELAQLAISDPQSIKSAPVTTPIGRLDEVAAAKDMIFKI